MAGAKKELRVIFQYLKEDGMAEAVGDLVSLVRTQGLESFDIVEISVDRLNSFSVPDSNVAFEKLFAGATNECFGCHREIGRSHADGCPVVGKS